jgi:hypothetical protein
VRTADRAIMAKSLIFDMTPSGAPSKAYPITIARL